MGRSSIPDRHVARFVRFPVLNDEWEVVGLHRASRTLPENVYLKGEMIRYNNLGVRMHAIVRHLPNALRDEIVAAQ